MSNTQIHGLSGSYLGQSTKIYLPACRHVQAWDAYIQHVADCGCPCDLRLPAEAYPQQSPQAAGILNDNVTQEEVQVALQNLHNGRAKGTCGLPSELLRYAKLPSTRGKPDPPHILVPTLTTLISILFRQGAVPESINTSLITPVYKKGDPFDTGNYRPIAVTEPIMRLYAGILKCAASTIYRAGTLACRQSNRL